MSKEPVNHPAFPVQAYAGDNTNPPVRPNSGMSIRDFFAGVALIGLANDKSAAEPDVAAENAFAFADAMLQERLYNRK
jgi:hypothetical protein